jgi:hypothetical protein
MDSPLDNFTFVGAFFACCERRSGRLAEAAGCHEGCAPSVRYSHFRKCLQQNRLNENEP